MVTTGMDRAMQRIREQYGWSEKEQHQSSHGTTGILPLPVVGVLDFRIELEKRIKRLQELLANLLFARSLDQVHRHRGIAPVLESDGSFAYGFQFVGRKQANAVNQRELRHQMNISSSCVAWSTDSRRPCAMTDTAARMPCIMPSTWRTGRSTACFTDKLALVTWSTVRSTAPSIRATCARARSVASFTTSLSLST